MVRKNQILIVIILLISFFSLFITFLNLFQGKDTTFKKKVVEFQYITQKGIVKLKLKGIIHDDEFNLEGINANTVVEWIEGIKKNKNILGVLIELDSPGGEVAPTKKIYKALMELKHQKPVVVYINGIAASGGYYIASSANKIIADESSIIGSIGVIMIRPNFKNFLDKLGVNFQVLKAGEYKDLSYPFRDLNEAEENMYKEILETTYSNFIRDVANARKQSEKTVIEQWAEGRIFSGKKAQSLQMIDENGGEKEALESLKTILNITEDLTIYEPQEEGYLKFFRFLKLFFYPKIPSFEINHSQIYYLYLNTSSIYNYFFHTFNVSKVYD